MAKKKEENQYSVLLDTSFIIRLLNKSDNLHSNAVGYYKYFLENKIPMYLSTVSIAEYCVKGDFNDLPFLDIRILPFNIFDAKDAGRFAKSLFEARNNGEMNFSNRLIIPNDTKIFAQGSLKNDIKYFVTSDVNSKSRIEYLQKKCNAQIEHMDINTPYTMRFALLDL